MADGLKGLEALAAAGREDIRRHPWNTERGRPAWDEALAIVADVASRLHAQRRSYENSAKWAPPSAYKLEEYGSRLDKAVELLQLHDRNATPAQPGPPRTQSGGGGSTPK